MGGSRPKNHGHPGPASDELGGAWLLCRLILFAFPVVVFRLPGSGTMDRSSVLMAVAFGLGVAALMVFVARRKIAQAGCQVSALFVYPIKSCAAVEKESLSFDQHGPIGDRRFMVVNDENGVFVTQRQASQLALIRPSYSSDGNLVVQATDCAPLHVDVTQGSGSEKPCVIWNEQYTAMSVGGEEAAEWLSQLVERRVSLVTIGPEFVRPPPTDVPLHDDVLSDRTFCDEYPVLLISHASVEDLSKRCKQPITFDRFRPNILVHGLEPYDEDSWARVRIGGSEFQVVWERTRCKVPCIDQNTGEVGPEPWDTLSRLRKVPDGQPREKKLLFGISLVPVKGAANIHKGDPVVVLERRTPVFRRRWWW